MHPNGTIKSFGVPVLVAGLAVAAAAGFGRMLRARAALVSRQQPAAEAWFEPVAPVTPALVARGRQLFLDSCAHCHGADARGDEGPDLHDAPVSDRYIGNIITHGIPHEMPSFAKKHGAPDISALTAYVRSLE